jgi:hypothetical protein
MNQHIQSRQVDWQQGWSRPNYKGAILGFLAATVAFVTIGSLYAAAIVGFFL